MRSSSGCSWRCPIAASSRRLRRGVAVADGSGGCSIARSRDGLMSGNGNPNGALLPTGRRPVGRNISRVGLALGLAFAVLAAGAGYWQVIEAQQLSNAPDNPAVIAAVRNVIRGRILDRDGTVLAT